jgi:hypothetical protein
MGTDHDTSPERQRPGTSTDPQGAPPGGPGNPPGSGDHLGRDLPRQSTTGSAQQSVETSEPGQQVQKGRGDTAAGPADSSVKGLAAGAALGAAVSELTSLPPPSELEKYETALPGAGQKILAMVEESHTAKIRLAKRNQYIAVALILLFFAASIGFFVSGNAVAGVIYAVIPILVLWRFAPFPR